jgi:hypothetical protein
MLQLAPNSRHNLRQADFAVKTRDCAKSRHELRHVSEPLGRRRSCKQSLQDAALRSSEQWLVGAATITLHPSDTRQAQL